MNQEIRRSIDIDMGHRVITQVLGGKPGPCSSCHGHRYHIEVCVNGNVIDEKGNPQEGMVIDFVLN